ncbi:carbohydrate ABC transporter permease [Cohnella cholangitidis]|uniref:Carbohydrate ABC transporter permease n=2 Tax=Cohnella cholangitidis TaxID=2598458 RepID=A0A7G5C7I1_9BACL|nr:carbohydrate ABC transporter permease [Cohnella cholangitidis]
MSILAFLAIAPFILLVISSFTDEVTAVRDGYSFFPEKFSIEAYKYIASEWGTLGTGYMVTIFVTCIGTFVGVTIAGLLGYVLSIKELPGRSILLFLVVFTMLFHGGAIATYIIYTQIFHLKNTIWGLIIPGLLLNGYFVMMFRTYFENSIPKALLESAKLDGASEIRIFFRIVFPISMPIVATVGVSYVLIYWNDWINGMYYLTFDSKLQSIQTILNNMNENINFLKNNDLGETSARLQTVELPTTTVRMALAVIGILPILCVFPLIQKWLVRGVTMGALKE